MKDLIVDALATYRLTRLVTTDAVTAPVREHIFRKKPPTPDSWTYLLTCDWCSSIWIGVGVALTRKIAPRLWDPLAQGLATSAVTGALAERL